MFKMTNPAVARTALYALLAVTACADPYRVKPPDSVQRMAQTAREAAASADRDNAGPRPRAISICYNGLFDEPAEVMALAGELCPNQGRVERVVGDVLWNNCALLQPARASFLCTPGTPPPSKFQ